MTNLEIDGIPGPYDIRAHPGGFGIVEPANPFGLLKSDIWQTREQIAPIVIILKMV